MLQLILNCLFALSNGLYDKQHIKTAFEMRLMCIAGYEPDLSACAVCGEPEPKEPRCSPQNGIICCRGCRKSIHEASVILCPDSLKALRYILYTEPKKLMAYSIPEDAAQKAADTAETYLLTQTERRFNALNYWKQVK